MKDSQKKCKELIPFLTSAFVFVMVAHGMALFNKYSFHDDVAGFNSVGCTFESGRWMLGLMDNAMALLFGGHTSIPMIHGLISALCIALMIYLLFSELKIDSKMYIVIAVGLLISYPAITEIFAYMYTASYYCFGSLLGVAGAYIFHHYKNRVATIICVTMMACSVGVYQSNISVCACSLLLFLISDILDTKLEWKEALKSVIVNFLICVGFMAEYIIIDLSIINVFGIDPVNYQGIDDFGVTGLSGYISRIGMAYRECFVPTAGLSRNMYTGVTRYIYIFTILLLVVMSVMMIIKIMKDNRVQGIILAILLIVYPLAAFIIYVMTDTQYIEGRMVFGESFMLILVMLFMSRIDDNGKKIVMKRLSVLALILILFMNTRVAIMCHLKAEILQTQAISYYTTLITRITSTEGYTAATPVVYINDDRKSYSITSGTWYLFNDLYYIPYANSSLINDYSWQIMMAFWCGFYPTRGDASLYQDNPEVRSMPCYPDDGSIEIVDGAVIVKFAD